MAEGAQSDLCEEPDADFFDTFFDDGVLETIGEVLGNQKPDEDSSCEPVDISSKTALGGRDECNRGTTSRTSPLLKTNDNNLDKEKLIVLKPAHIKDQISSSTTETLGSATASIISSSTQIRIDVRNEEKSECGSGTLIPCKDSDSSISNPQDSVSNEKTDNGKKLGFNELLSKVQQFLKDSTKQRKPQAQDFDADVSTSLNSSQPSRKEEKNELSPKIKLNHGSEVKEKFPSNSESDVNKAVQKEKEPELDQPTPNHCETSQVCRTKGGELMCENDNLIHSHTSNSGFMQTSENGQSDPMHKVPQMQDDTEKENDLTLEETCPKNKQQQSPPGKKISINLKTQILASTTILNSGSPEKANQCTSSTANKRRKDSTASPSRLKLKDLSPISDEDTNLKKHDKKKRREHVATRGSISPDQEKTRYSSRARKQRKKKKRENSPKISRRDRDDKNIRTKRKTTRARSPSPQYHESRYSSWKKSKRDRSPNANRRKRPRSSSRSPSISSLRHYMRRSSRSPFRHRTRSRSYSPGHRFRQSTSPTVRRRRSSRSKSRSPFINEYCRLKRQWDKEDEEKRSSSQYIQSHPGGGPTHLPVSQPWSNEVGCSSSTFVSNMMSVQVHSTSFTFDHLPQSYVPANFNAPPMPPDSGPYGTTPPLPSLAIALPPAPGSEASLPYSPSSLSSRPQCDLSVLPPFSVPPPLPVPLIDVDKHQTSMLRKQLDILKSTVVSLSEPCTSLVKCGTKNVETCSQSSFQYHHEPANIQNISPPPKSYQKNKLQPDNQSPESNFSNLKNQTSSSSKDNVGVAPVNADVSTPSIAFQSPPLTDNSSSTRIPDSENARNYVTDSSHKPPKLTSCNILHTKDCNPSNDETCTQPTSQAEVDNDASKTMTQISEKSSQCSADPPLLTIADNQAQVPDEQYSDLKGEQNDSANAVIEDEDSDCIIEELPPRPPVELICLSEDEVEDHIQACAQDELDHEFDLLNMGLEPTYQSTQLNDEKAEPQTVLNEAKKRGEKRKRKRSKKRREGNHTTPASRIDRNLIVVEASKKNCEQKTIESSEDTSEDTHNSILNECREMIDSLRIGRFVVEDEDPSTEPLDKTEKEKSTSTIHKSCKIEFSFTQRPPLEEVPETKDASTNTPIQLCIDVCTETESYVMSKDCMTQTDLSCTRCNEKETLMKEMNDQLLSLKKERDDLHAIVCSLKKTPTIPGLDFSSTDVKTSQPINDKNMSSSYLIFDTPKSESNKVAKICKDMQSTTNFWPHVPHKTLIANEATSTGIRKSCESDGTNFLTSPNENVQRGTLLSYEYNHSLPN